MNLAGKSENELLYIGFNQDQGCFACGVQTGFRIFNCDPLKERFKRDFGSGGIGFVEMLFRCNILALVGGGRNPRYPPNKVMIWDDYQNKCIVELEFRSEVKAVKLRRDRIVVALETKLYIYNFADLKPLYQYDTFSNPDGLCALCPNTSNSVIAFPGLQKGFVHVELYDQKKTTIIPAHDNSLSCISLNMDGSRLATASEKGTLIRVFDTFSGQILHELRRGSDRADIYSLCFNNTSEYISVTSDKGTIHIFNLGLDEEHRNASRDDVVVATPSSPKHSVEAVEKIDSGSGQPKQKSFLKGILPKYFNSERSFAQFAVPNGRALCCFGQEKNTIVVVCADGTYYKCSFDPVKGGDCTIEKQLKFTSD
eukprot:TRINITY_DN1251_c0_g1_i1.p1 TRINITY_DN1251_c0_g1~~TRINITY_DN1251_c0_g1_i1.p1  ORF type:complete len:368 (-),score=80.80 TRINITY_DN1251_c0_g1_i1:119-1222(-)